MNEVNSIFFVVILIMSVVIHEISHGYAALFYGDQTAKLSGRLTLNPIKHLDLFGSIIIPLILVITQAGFIFGWAKPVPYNPRNLRDQKWGVAFVAIAGIFSNLVIALFFSLLIRLAPYLGFASGPFIFISSSIVLVNLLLAIFNLIPIPPLDGSKILFAFLPFKYKKIEFILERYSMIFVVIFILFLWQYFSPLIFGLFKILTGINF